MAQYRFKGTDGSLGYRTGAIYEADVKVDGATCRIVFVPINPAPEVTPITIPFSTVAKFMQNWEWVRD